MKKNFALLTSIILTATLGQAQTGGGGAGQSGAAGQSGGANQSGGSAQPGIGAGGTSQPGQNTGQAGGIGNPSPFQPRVNPPQPRNPSQPGVGGQEGTIFNQPAGANQPLPGQFGGTNQVRFGGTNQVGSGGTNRIQFGGTNVQPGGTVNEAAGATSATNQGGFSGQIPNQPGLTNQQGGILAEQAFSQQMRAVLSRPGATQIFFPQTRSTVSVMNQNGALVLTGSVTSEEEKQSIESRIQNTPGVVSIDNQLQVGNNGQNGVSTPRTRGINPAPNSGINQGQGQDRRLLNP